jgi:periplasmic protein TonB
MNARRPAPQRRKSRRLLPVAAVGLAVITVAGGAVALVRNFLASPASPPKQIVQQIQLIRPPPPPPDLPPPPPPPPEEKVDVQEPPKQPDPTPSNDPPPSDHLGLDAEGGAGGDAFGLVGNKGGRDLLASAGSAYAWYTGLVKDQILSQLSSEKQVRSGEYTVTVRVWVREDGSIQRVTIVQGSGSRERDHVIEAALEHLDRLPQAPPADMPEPINLRIVSRR